MATHHKLPTSPHSAVDLGRSLHRSAALVHLCGMGSEAYSDDRHEPRAAPGPGDLLGESLDQALTLQELAARLNVKVQTLYDLRSQGRGPRGFRVGREIRFRLSEIDAWLARMEAADAERHPRGRSR